MKKCLVIGYGSIGKRHAEVLQTLGCDVSLVTSQQTNKFYTYPTLADAIKHHNFEYIVIANPTSEHFISLSQLVQCNYQGMVLVEKPLSDKPINFDTNSLGKIFVAYNLRFSQPLQILKKILGQEELISFSVNVGQYLPAWRPDRDYRESYSAKRELGGGVLNDLSHELDYCTWICGKSLEVSARGGHYSDLEINSDDIYSILMRCEFCPIVNLQINYLDRVKRRDIFIHTRKHSIFLDLVSGTLQVDGETVIAADGISETYLRQHDAILKKDFTHICTYQDGMDTVKLIQTILAANTAKAWVSA